MPILDPGPHRIAYRQEGPADAPMLVLSNSPGTAMAMWDAQADALARRFRVLRYDTRGHGASGQGGCGIRLHARGARRRRAAPAGRPRHRTGQLLRHLDGRADRPVARRPCRRPARAARRRQQRGAHVAADLREEVGAIAVPTLLVAGRHDPVTTVADALFGRERVAGARCVTLEASHLSNVEAAQAFTDQLLAFLA